MCSAMHMRQRRGDEFPHVRDQFIPSKLLQMPFERRDFHGKQHDADQCCNRYLFRI